jgi:glycosyltransferase involved in cell wall biosynthesis
MMRIAQVAPLYERVPPTTYGGTERVVSYLTEELVKLGHDVTLFASGDSRTTATLVPMRARSIRTDVACLDPLASHLLMLEEVARAARDFDVVHFHTGFLQFPVARRLACAHVTTLHGRLDLPDLPALFDEFLDMPLVSISYAQRRPLAHASWQRTVYHGIPAAVLPFSPKSRGYLVFVGRISPEKRPDRAIEIARHAGLPLKIAAKVDNADRDYFHDVIEPMLSTPGVEFIGEVDESQKAELLGGAQALLFPIDWPEPFGMVLIEAMACGTPIVAWGHGSVPEIVEHGSNGFIVNSIRDAAAAVVESVTLDRAACRAVFEARFTADRMAQDYVSIYEKLLERSVSKRGQEGQRDRSRRGPESVLHRHGNRAAGRPDPRSEAW